ncbi:fructose-specific PTS transporter subunit EIIC [Erysipelothrix rhusiopathiae]|uniref:Phosphoenolpyruvate-dependent sugar phosphotransferase system, EIIA 2 n=1 Tax=Erysipelothrix rhusiopathiae ATCC 19414 TaxID=525280 RepID=E7FX43_ERYRH|nr:fructose-specific PTS transporter subunit EIIC [Erysipelothrix rhusiopathiae]EFY08559.1 phosphoenolpyruvate-dependent sugar phosphotransferase system, EIIA 2 [Erysipelothrix rhusiopathiae ATCC 19414]MDE8193081.1 fructose-specific PTS transporter subunit EIIC [Erysipelothrix rhusiopathiae]MDE8338822.1 fructose-specific PTS transporter subunit EIIC [Erysipelothrix rhusiopathiae]MDE8341268.1 fructose-specific PTS transporter subunit EIIC [Erysipelothrix rhusiopathiae]MDV7680120.1 fructose-spec
MKNITQVLKPNLVIFNLNASSKDEVLTEMAQKLSQEGIVANEMSFIETLKEREAISTTGVGDGIAIPHGRSSVVSESVVVFGRSDTGIDFASMDGKPAHLFFMIATPENSGDDHLSILSTLSGLLMKSEVQEAIRTASTYDELVEAFDIDNEPKQEVVDSESFVVAVTACATGIAHTYMAAEKLQETAKNKGIAIKVETNGSSGVGNRLTQDDIKNADAVIVAADINVEMNRFNGKKLIKVPVASAISHPDSLIDKALTEADVYTASSTDSSNEESEGSNLYKHLLNGVSHMLPFVVGGGILIAIAFMLDQLIGVPTAELGQLGSYNAFPAILKDIGGQAFGFMLPVLAGYIAYSIADRPGLVVGFVAGGIASTGGAGFLGALIGGFLAGYTMNMIKKLLTNLPQSLDGIKTILLYPVLGVLVTGLLMVLINIPMKSVNEAMNGFLNGLSGTNAVLLGALLGGMMAVDLGGPINKAAYVFGTGTLAATAAGQGSAVMAAVMAAGMVPPLAVFVATLLFKHKFKAEERQAGMTNLILGASFITEGAIPFASSDPLRVIPSFIVGSALTGALSLAFNITVNAPHGGLFVILLVSQPLLYILFIIIGSVVSGLLMGILKRI